MLRFVVLDTETTGFVPKTHRVMEIAAVAIENGKIVEEFESLLSLPPGADIPIAVQILTKITPEDLKGKPTFDEVLPKLKKMVTKDTILVGQNLAFDASMLRGEGWDIADRASIDTAMLASLVFPELPSVSLGFVSEVLKLNHSPKHRALGDVRATAELLMKCVERLEELPKKTMDEMKVIAAKASEGYRRFFESLEGKGKKSPAWLSELSHARATKAEAIELSAPTEGAALVEEPLTADATAGIIAGLKGNMWFAVKNVDALLRTWQVPKNVHVVVDPERRIDAKKKSALLAQKQFSADEALLAIKLLLYPGETKDDLPLHGGEYQTFTAKLAMSAGAKPALPKSGTPVLLSHRELFRILREIPDALPKSAHVIIDDASMLEDTITQAEGWVCSLPVLRAAAAGNKLLTQCADTVELWTEKTRSEQTIRYLAPSDLQSKESTRLTELLDQLLETDLPENVANALTHLKSILNTENLSGRLAWIETMMDGSKIINSVPENVAPILYDRLLSRTPTTLLIPRGGAKNLAAILDHRAGITMNSEVWKSAPISIEFPIGVALDHIIEKIEGKCVLLVGSKRVIEEIFVRHAESAEERGMTLICQGFSGGHGRMQAEFLSAKENALLVLTPWMYEGMELLPDSISTLYLHTFPFDHPSHAVISRRADRYQNGFSQYSLPRVLNRLFRLVRTFVRHAAKDAKIVVIDERIRTKGYGKDVKAYLESLVGTPKTPKEVKVQMPLL